MPGDNVRNLQDRPLPAPPNPLLRVCPILSLAAPRPSPSGLVGAAPQSIVTVNCVGMRCAFFHPVGACAILVMSDALLTQTNVMIQGIAQQVEKNEKSDPAQPV